MGMIPKEYDLSRLDVESFTTLSKGNEPVVILLPVGCVEPHGPHLPLATDTMISAAAAVRAAELLRQKQLRPLIAPAVAYGVTRCARQFLGAVSVSPEALATFLESVVRGFLDNHVRHVCIINNHLEPEHDRTVQAVAEQFEPRWVSVATPLKRRWARTLSDEFKSGACHAGEYETSIVLAADSDSVDMKIGRTLPAVPVSLSEKLKSGMNDFVEMGLKRAYCGAPAKASPEHGKDQLEKLAAMIVGEITENL